MNISFTPAPVALKTTPTIKTMKVKTWYKGIGSWVNEYYYLTSDNILVRFTAGTVEAGTNTEERWLSSFQLVELQPGEIKITVP